MASIFLSTGITLDLLGIGLVAASDWWPDALEVRAAAGRRYASMKARVKSAFQGEHHSGSSRLGTAVEFDSAGQVIFKGRASSTESIEMRLIRLEYESRQARERLGKIEGDVREIPTAWRRDIATARAELADLIDRRLTETEERYRGARQLGVVCLFAGLAFTSLSIAF